LFAFTSIEHYHAQLQEGTVSCVQAVQYYLDRIHATRHLNAFIEVYAEEALQKAAALDLLRKKEGRKGRLHGVVIGLKDVICYKGHLISAASRILQNFSSLYSATAVERLLKEEAIIIGNLNCDEFAMGSTNENSSYGRVLQMNPGYPVVPPADRPWPCRQDCAWYHWDLIPVVRYGNRQISVALSGSNQPMEGYRGTD
jgi:aspartyl-tRNA(Asn)/glutamyl-tRNA(Gln) amidotransferase subunit A